MPKKAAFQISNRTLIHRVLEQVNDVRRALAIGEGKLARLPKAIPGDPHQCVLARALSNGWVTRVSDYNFTLTHDVDGIDWPAIQEALLSLGFPLVKIGREVTRREVKSRKLTVSHTPEFAELVERFDSALIPHLILEQREAENDDDDDEGDDGSW
jgi:hypothetical protein